MGVVTTAVFRAGCSGGGTPKIEIRKIFLRNAWERRETPRRVPR
jgi:hypothetical protein